MKNLKFKLLIPTILFALTAKAQNTFPTSGNVGIGTASPTEKLDVKGTIQSNYLKLNAATPVEGGEIQLDGPNGFNNWQIDNYSGDFRLHHSGSEYFRVFSNGNVSIPDLGTTGKKHLSIGDDAFFTDVDKTNMLGLYGNQDSKVAGLKLGSSESYLFGKNNNIGIGTTNPDSKLTVKGNIHCEEVLVDSSVPADYVFQTYYTGTSTLKADYTMPTLEEIEAYTKANHHLPEVPSAQEIQENGMKISEMTNLLLQKIEELTLYTIEQEKRIKALETQIAK